MIRFETRSIRNPEVEAWNVTIDAIFVPDETVFHGAAFQSAFDAQPQCLDEHDNEHGVRIARLKAILINGPHFEIDDFADYLEELVSPGGIVDIEENACATGIALLDRVNAGRLDAMFEELEPVETLVFTSMLEADAFVDRGSILAYMMPHLNAFSSGRMIVAHQEHLDEMIPEDQRNRAAERLTAVHGICTRMGITMLDSDVGAQARCETAETRHNVLGEPLVGENGLPFLVLDLPCDGPASPVWILYDEDTEVIDFPDWAEARLGVRPELDGEMAYAF